MKRWWIGCLMATVVAAWSAAGCQDQDYVGENNYYSFAITESTPPFFSTDEASLYLVERRVELPIKEPSMEKMQELQNADMGDLPFSRMPWVELGDYDIELDWTISNLDDEYRTVDITINGFNEFHEYQPSFVIDDDEIIPEFAQYERKLRLEPQERRSGTIREDAFEEAAVDLATVVNGAPNANQVVHPMNDSDNDPRAEPYIPSVIPGLTGFRLGLRSEGASNIVFEATVRLRDNEDRIVGESKAWELPEPEIFMPASDYEP